MEEIDLKEVFNMLWNKKIVISTIVIVFIIIGMIYTKFMIKPDYKAVSKLVLTKNAIDSSETITQTEVTLNQKLVATYTVLIKSNDVLRPVITNLNLDINEDNLKDKVSVTLVPNTLLIEIAVTNENPETAKEIENEITKVFMEKAKEIYVIDNISLVDVAKTPTTPYNINHTKNIILFTFIGIMIAGAYIIFISMLDTTIKNSEEVENRLGVIVLASIPNYDYDGKKKGKKQ